VLFYTIVFSLLAVLLVVAGITVFTRNRRQLDAEERHDAYTSDAHKRERKAKRTQSRNARRKR
jgi:hypothetical protein